MVVERWIDRSQPELSTARDVRLARVAARQHGVVVLGQAAPQHPRINGHRTSYLPAKKLARILGTEAAPTQSELEDVVLELILSGGFAHPLVNEPLLIAGRRIVPDFHWPEQRLVIEADGPHHDEPLERAADRQRQAILEAHGSRVVRVTWEQAIAHPAATLGRIAAAGAPRAVDWSG